MASVIAAMGVKAVTSRLPLHPLLALWEATHDALHVRTLHRGQVYLASQAWHTAHCPVLRGGTPGGGCGWASVAPPSGGGPGAALG